MDTGKFLRKLADLIDVAMRDEEPAPMVPPLQQTIELLKKVAGEDSIYDEKTCDCEGECTCAQQPVENTPDEELDILKRNAGLIVASNSFPE